MSKPITVRDRAGNMTIRHDGVVLDGDQVQTTIRLMDQAKRGTPVHMHGARILGDAWDAKDYAGMTDAAARQAIVKRKLGDAAAGKSAAFLDAAWNTLAGVPKAQETAGAEVTSHHLDRGIAARGVAAALRDHAARTQVTDAGNRFAVADRAVMQDAKAEQNRTLSDGWKTPDVRAREAGYRADAVKADGDQRVAAMRDMDATIRDGWRRGAR